MLSRSNCQITHDQIAEGSCPHCGLPIVGGAVGSVRSSSGEAIRWNIDYMVVDYRRSDESERIITLSNLIRSSATLSELVPILSVALEDHSEQIFGLALRLAVISASSAKNFTADYYENQLQQEPFNLGLLSILLIVYFKKQYDLDSARRSRCSLVLHLIGQCPDAFMAGLPYAFLNPQMDGQDYEQAASLWLGHIASSGANVRTLGNAALFFAIHNKTLAIELLRKCQTLDPGNSKWASVLGMLYETGARPSDSNYDHMHDRREQCVLALEELERGLVTANDDLSRLRLLSRLPLVAFDAGESAKARGYAEKLLEIAYANTHVWDPGRAVHQANTVLGRIALLSGDIDTAKVRLIASVTPMGRSFKFFFGNAGPNMTLAKDLLGLGERDAVIGFLLQCENLNHDCGTLTTQWSAEIRRGETPDFGFTNYI